MSNNKTRKQIAKEKEKLAVITDGCNPELVDGAEFDGYFEIPIIKKPSKIKIPKGMVPFSKMSRVEPEKFAVCEYELDKEFSDLLRYTDSYVSELRKYQAFISPDASLYWDMPFASQVVNKYRSQAIGYYMQKRGLYVIPNVRWGDERTYSTKIFPDKLAFLGAEKHSIVSIGSYGVVKTRLEKYHFKAGLEAMLEELEPEVVLVYGAMPEELFEDYKFVTEFVRYPDWTSYIRSENNG